MSVYDYAHNDTSGGERKTRTAQFNRYRCAASTALGDEIQRLRADAFAQEIPTACDETLNFICNLAHIKDARNMLELGTGTGISGICLLERCPQARLTTIEKNEQFFTAAQKNFSSLGMGGRVTLINGDAGEEICRLAEDSFDFIFMDSAKVQYLKYLPALKKLLKKGGVLAADDVLLYGWVTGEVEPPKKRMALIRHIREYIDAVTNDEALRTTIIDIGDGIALSVKI